MNNTPIVKRCEEYLRKRRHEILPVLQHLTDESRADIRPASLSDDAACAASVTSRLAAVYERELKDIDTALYRIRAGTFGHCRACHQAIEPSRLERFPRADFCLRCKDV